MNLHEYQSKQLFDRYGIPVPNGLVASNGAEAADAARKLGGAKWVVKAQERLRAWRESENTHMHGNAIPVRPEQLATELVRACPHDTLFVADTGYVGTWAGVFMDLPAGKNFLHCEGSLGWAFPAAMGAKAAVPERPVVAFTGDGGFFYHLAEIETAAPSD